MATIFLITGLGRAVKEFRACGPPPREPNTHQRRGYSRPVSMIRFFHVLVLALTIELRSVERTSAREVTQFAYDAFRLVERACCIMRHSRWSKLASTGLAMLSSYAMRSIYGLVCSRSNGYKTWQQRAPVTKSARPRTLMLLFIHGEDGYRCLF